MGAGRCVTGRSQVGADEAAAALTVHGKAVGPAAGPGRGPAPPTTDVGGVEPGSSWLHSVVRACHRNCAKNLPISALVQVVTPLS